MRREKIFVDDSALRGVKKFSSTIRLCAGVKNFSATEEASKMFEDGARIDDILNALKKPTLDDDDNDKKNYRISDTGIRYDSQRPTVGETNIKFDFARNSEGLL